MKHTPNLILLADAYKYSHARFYYPGTSGIYSYLESRGGLFNDTIFFGLQYILKKYLAGPVISTADIDEGVEVLQQVFGRTDVFDRSLFDHIVEKHGGRLPVRIKAVREGSKVPVNNVLLTIENTDSECYWLPNFLETLLMQVWYPCTVATLSHQIRALVEEYYSMTASEEAFRQIAYTLNDFGFRGVSSVESAGIGGAAHLLSFSGSDNISASLLARDYYQAQGIYGRSVPATEHSICTLLGEEGELEVFRHVLSQYPEGTIACVSDSFNIFRACSEYWGDELKALVLNRKGTLVIRPDSGDPVRTLLEVFDILLSRFGYTVNAKGYKVLPPQVRVLQGDGIDLISIRKILAALKEQGISAENLLLGMGGALLQKTDRDTQKFALKCSWAQIGGQGVDVSKHPLEMDPSGQVTPSFKRSRAGRLKLIRTNEGYQTVQEHEAEGYADELVTVFENGYLISEQSFETVRTRSSRTCSPELTFC